MAKDKKKEYANIIDAFLDDREPDWAELGLKDAVKSGEKQLKRTHDYIDGDVLEEISESVESHHTMLPGGGKGGKKKLTSDQREARLDYIRANSTGGHGDMNITAAVPEDWARHSQNATNEDSVLGDVLHDIEAMHDNPDGLKKKLSDQEVTGRIDNILGSGLTAAEKTAALKKLGEIELFNRGMATDYLNNAAPQIGIDYLQPNTYMDKNSPTYERDLPKVSDSEVPADKVKCDNCDGGENAYPGCTVCQGTGYMPKDQNKLPGLVQGNGAKVMAAFGFTAAAKEYKTATENVIFAHEDATTVTIGLKANTWSHAGRGGSVKQTGKGIKALVAYLSSKSYGRGLAKDVGQRDGKIAEAGIQRTADQHSEKTASVVAQKTAAQYEFDSGDIERLRKAGQTLPYIYKFATAKVGEFGAAKALNAWLAGKKKGGEIILPAIDVKFLRDTLGFKGASVEKQVGKAGAQVVKGDQAADGHKILAEYDLQETKTAADINTDGVQFEELDGVFGLNL